MAWRVGSGGLRVINPDGSEYRLPPGIVLDEVPISYEGTLTVVVWGERPGYSDKMLRPAEDKQAMGLD